MKPTVLSFLLLCACTAFSQTKLLENTNLSGAILNGKPLLLDSVGNLWTTDGTPAGTKIFTTKVKAAIDSLGSMEGIFAGTKVYFAGKTAATGVELWCTDGTDAGTFQVKDISAGPKSTDIGDFFLVNNKVCFGANDGVNGYELWITDGTTGGTKLLKDLTGDPSSAKLSPFGFLSTVTLNNTVYFFADDSLHGYELWKTDGTESGTKLVKDINPNNTGSDELALFTISALGNAVYFFADDGEHDTQLWRSDGTVAGTYMVKDIFASNASTVDDQQLLIFKSKLYFTATKGTEAELWVSDGTSAGTTKVKGFTTSSFSNTISLGDAVTYPDKFVFSYSYYDNTFKPKSELWTSDGTDVNTKKMFTAPGSTLIAINLKYDNIYDMVSAHNPPFSGKVFFETIDYLANTGQLWITDGTTIGTTTVSNNVATGLYGIYLYGATSFYFWGRHTAATDSISLYKTDGTVNGTKVIQSFPKLAKYGESNYPLINFEYNGDVYYCAYDKKDNSNINDFYRTGSGSSVPPVSGTYTFTGNGSWDVASNWLNNQIPPANLSGGEIIIDPVAGGECLVSGAKTLAPGVKLTIKSNKKLRFTN